MNETQKRYAVKRIDELLQNKAVILRRENTVDSIIMSCRERIELIRTGKVKLLSKKKLKNLDTYYSNIKDIFDFSAFDVEYSFNQKEFDKKYTLLLVAANKIKDEIMLGDEEQALIMIRAFEKM